MKVSNRLKGSILAGLLAGVVVIGCNRPIQVAPTLPGITDTRTSTATSVFTPTTTTTPITMGLASGPAAPPNSTQVPGAAGIPVMQLSVSNPSATGAVTLTGLTLNAGGSGNDATGITDINVYYDANGDGLIDGGDTLLTPAANTFPGDNGTLSLTFGSFMVMSPSATANILVTYNFSGSAPAGTYQPTLPNNTSVNGTDITGQPLSFTGAPINGATLTIAAPTSTATNTATHTRTNTGASTATSTATRTFTFSATRTSTTTATQTSTRTNTGAATSTSTSSATSTSTSAFTSTPTFTPCYPASFQAAYTFDAGIDCWMPSTPSQALIPYYGVDNAQVDQGTNSLHIAVNNTSGSPQNIQMNLGFAAPIDLTGMMMVAMVYVDPSLAPSDYSGGVLPFYQSGPNWGSAVWDDEWFTVNNTPPANVGAWFPVTIIFAPGPGDPTQVLQIGIQLNNVPDGAIGNFYIDNVQIIPAPAANTPTETPTATETPTDTPMGAPICTVTPVNPNVLSEAESVSNGGPSTGTNDTCATAEDLGTLDPNADIQINGSLLTVGNTGSDYLPGNDFDRFRFTTPPGGSYTVNITLDCFSTGADGNFLDLYIYSDSGCVTLGLIYGNGPSVVMTGTGIPGGTSYILGVVGWDAISPLPYKMMISTVALPTPTPTMTDTDTPSVPTDTPTDTPTETPTDTPTETPTSAACVPTVQASYDFETDDECFTAWNGPGDTATSVDTNTANTHNASNGSFMVTGTFSAGEVLVGLEFPSSATIPMGSIVSFYYKASTTTGNAQLFHQSPGWASGNWQNNLSTSWVQVSFAMTGGTEGSTNQLGMQFLNLNGAVTIWIDDVTISAPPTPTPTPMAECNPLFNGFETLTDNGSLTGSGSNKSLSTLHATQGTYSLDLNIVSPTGWNDQLLRIGGTDPGDVRFAPSSWTNATQLMMDVYLENPASGYNELFLYADSQPAGKYYQRISSSSGAMVAGQQTVVWNLDYSPGTILPSDPITGLRFLYNSGSPAVAGHIYVDNLRLLYSPCPPAPLLSWPFTSSVESWTDHAGDGTLDAGVVTSWLPTGYAGGAGAVNVSVPFTGTDQYEWVKIDTGGIDLTGSTTIEMYVWIDASIAGTGYPGGQVIVQSGAAWGGWEQGAWTNLAPGGWTKLTFTPAWGGTTDITTVQRIAIQVHTGGAGTGQATGNIKVDNVKVY